LGVDIVGGGFGAALIQLLGEVYLFEGGFGGGLIGLCADVQQSQLVG
jgi:hypothetical protein